MDLKEYKPQSFFNAEEYSFREQSSIRSNVTKRQQVSIAAAVFRETMAMSIKADVCAAATILLHVTAEPSRRSFPRQS